MGWKKQGELMLPEQRVEVWEKPEDRGTDETPTRRLRFEREHIELDSAEEREQAEGGADGH